MSNSTSSCEAAICVKHNKLKNINGKVYLRDKQEFEIEIFNPSQSNQLAKIKINGNYISQNGVVIKPGQRIYLERYLNIAKKFLFETYEVDDIKEVNQAIKLNGQIQVEFYQEHIRPEIIYHQPLYFQSGINTNNTCSGTLNLLNTTNTSGMSINSLTNINTAFFNNTVTTDSLSSCNSNVLRKKETGTIEKGSNSSQTFLEYLGSFNSFTSGIIVMQILPVSEKPLEVKDLAIYCTNCGSKNKKNWKFCPKCGEEFE